MSIGLWEKAVMEVRIKSWLEIFPRESIAAAPKLWHWTRTTVDFPWIFIKSKQQLRFHNVMKNFDVKKVPFCVCVFAQWFQTSFPVCSCMMLLRQVWLRPEKNFDFKDLLLFLTVHHEKHHAVKSHWYGYNVAAPRKRRAHCVTTRTFQGASRAKARCPNDAMSEGTALTFLAQ